MSAVKEQEKPLTIEYLPLSEISESPFDPRREATPEPDDQMVESIREHGVLQPVLVRALLTGHELIGGHRRVRAARRAGLEMIPAVVRHGVSDREASELAIVDNVMRQQISLLDEAFAYKRLRDEFKRNADEIAARCNRSKTSIYDALRVVDLPDAVIELTRKGKLHYSHLVALTAVMENDQKLWELAENAARSNWTAKLLEGVIQTWKEGQAREAAEKHARENPPLPIEDEAKPETEAASVKPVATVPDTPLQKPDSPSSAEEIPAVEKTPEPAKPTNPTPQPAPVASTPAAPKVPDGMISTFVPKDDCLFCQDAGLTMQDVFAMCRRIIEMGQPKGLSAEDVLATTEALLND